MSAEQPNLNYEQIRRRLAGARGRRFWRGLEELAETEAFTRFLHAEFPAIAAIDDVSRRGFLRVMGGSMMLAGLAGCGESPTEVVPYVNQPEEVIPGKPRFYATAVMFEGYAQPVLGECHVGRPTKLEGNPGHPMSAGATDAFTQAAVLQLYDPDRSQVPTFMGRPTTWGAFETAMVSLTAKLAADKGAGLRILTGAVTSPTLRRQLDELTARYPQARWHVFEAVGENLRHEATRRAFGRPIDLHLRLDEAAVTVSLEDDFLGPGPHQLVNARRWAERRAAAQRGEGPSLLHVAESTPSLTGAVATSRCVTSSGRIARLMLALAGAVGVADIESPDLEFGERDWIGRAAKDLQANAGHSLLTVGGHQSPEIQALGFRINERLGNAGVTVLYSEPVAALPPDGFQSFEILVRDMAAGQVETLVVLESNPVYAAPGDLDFTAAMEKVRLCIHAGLHVNETAAHSHWHVPTAHVLESWSDARAVDGTATVVQPLVRPLYDVRSIHQILALLAGTLGAEGQAIVRDTWRPVFGEAEFETRWRHALHDGLVPDGTAPMVKASARSVPLPKLDESAARDDTVEVVFRPDPNIWDGRFANHAWLQELPKPLTKLTWDNVVYVSPALGEELGIGNGDNVEIRTESAAIRAPAWIMPGQARRTVTVFLGYGRRRAGRVGEGIGYDAYPLRTSTAPWFATASVLRGEGRVELATTQAHFSMEGFDLVRVVERAHADEQLESRERRPTLYSGHGYGDPSWGMTIDLDRCIGCNACVVACQAENNIAVVGKEQVGMGREMHWLRVDRYYDGPVEAPRTHFQPVPCMHCEQAPCEMGCPVHATVHGPEGLNEMVYNRCIGTRTCSSFCPYKVRRFNWYDYTSDDPPSVQAQRNPDVTVRDRGIMEKCTYCVQRISAARIEAKKEERPIREGEVVTACQAVCPTQVIVFGNIADPDSAVSRSKRSPRNYSLLEELNTWPRTTYLAEISDDEPSEDGEKS